MEFPATAVPMGLAAGKPVGVQVVALPGRMPFCRLETYVRSGMACKSRCSCVLANIVQAVSGW